MNATKTFLTLLSVLISILFMQFGPYNISQLWESYENLIKIRSTLEESEVELQVWDNLKDKHIIEIDKGDYDLLLKTVKHYY